MNIHVEKHVFLVLSFQLVRQCICVMVSDCYKYMCCLTSCGFCMKHFFSSLFLKIFFLPFCVFFLFFLFGSCSSHTCFHSDSEFTVSLSAFMCMFVYEGIRFHIVSVIGFTKGGKMARDCSISYSTTALTP